jgi:hypothetical protein
MINKLKNLYYSIISSRNIRIKIISSLVFIVLFFLICIVFELFAKGLVANQINKLIHEILIFGL